MISEGNLFVTDSKHLNRYNLRGYSTLYIQFEPKSDDYSR